MSIGWTSFLATTLLMSVPHQSPTDRNWCSEPYDGRTGTWQRRSDFTIAPVRADRMDNALEALREESFYRLSDREAAYYGVQRQGRRDHLYLVRASVVARRGATTAELIDAAAGVSFEIHLNRSTQQLLIVIIQTIHEPLERYNLAAIVHSSEPISSVNLSCFTMS
jgi:hypothetical protein